MQEIVKKEQTEKIQYETYLKFTIPFNYSRLKNQLKKN